MADVRPFRAVRYARPTDAVTTPPYDVIDLDQRRELLARDPHNIAHLTLEPDPAIAGTQLRQWLADGVLVRDETPAVWWLEQDFVGPDGVRRSRHGIVASLGVEPYATGAVLPHERTHPGPIEGRLALLRATRTQLEPIFLLYEDPPPIEAPRWAPEMQLADVRLWRIDGDHGVHEFFADRQVLIADGHHRYETAVAFAAEDGADRILAVLVSATDPGLAVFPTHRVFVGRPDVDPPGEPFASVGDALGALDEEPAARSAAVLVRADEIRLVRGGAGELDVELVDRFGHGGLSYTPDGGEAVRRVASGEADSAFLLRPLRVADVFARARIGKTMPPKATYFFPKLLSGLLLQPVDA
ncbi:MAG: DUF1015 domain-containing protein [Gaiella sp.]|nr:DUF1015 domain-containing protein [Gaiella sp.]